MERNVMQFDEPGQELGRGHFLPKDESREQMRILYKHAREMFSEEDIEAARGDPEELTTARVLDYLNPL